MRAAKLRHRIHLYNRVFTDDGYGGDDTELVFSKSIWADVMQFLGDEVYLNNKTTAVYDYKIEVRANTQKYFNDKMVIKYKEQILYIKSNSDIKQQHNRVFIKALKGDPSKFSFEVETELFTITSKPVYTIMGKKIIVESAVV